MTDGLIWALQIFIAYQGRQSWGIGGGLASPDFGMGVVGSRNIIMS